VDEKFIALIDLFILADPTFPHLHLRIPFKFPMYDISDGNYPVAIRIFRVIPNVPGLEASCVKEEWFFSATEKWVHCVVFLSIH
jgi:hypothetical protein